MNKYQIALNYVSKVTMALPINDQIIKLQECVNEHLMYKRAFEKACEELDIKNKHLCELDNRFFRVTKEKWKECILNEVNNE